MQNQVRAFLLLRMRLLICHYRSLGGWYGLVVTLALLVYYTVLIRIPFEGRYSELVAGILVLLPAILIHFSRKDFSLLKVLRQQAFIFLWSEYYLLLFPALVIMAARGFYLSLSASMITVLLLAFYPVKPAAQNRDLPSFAWIPPYAYEWRTGLRSGGWMLIILTVLSLLSLAYPYIGFFILWCMHALIISFYQQHESEAMVRQAQSLQPGLLYKKVFQGISAQLTLFAPVSAGHLILYHGSGWLVMFFLLMVTVNLAFCIVVKYRYFHPRSKGGPASFYQSLSLLSLFIPFLLPVPLVLGLFFLKKAKSNILAYGSSN